MKGLQYVPGRILKEYFDKRGRTPLRYDGIAYRYEDVMAELGKRLDIAESGCTEAEIAALDAMPWLKAERTPTP